MDEQRLNAFIVARGLLERGTASIDGTSPGAVAAVVLYDLAVETAAKAVRAAHPVTSYAGSGYDTKRSELTNIPVRDPNLGRVLDDVLAAHRQRVGEDTADLEGRRDALALHKFRNGVQHDGNVPSRDDVDRARLRATDFLESLLQQFYNIELTDVSRARLLRDHEVRDRVEQAEKAASKSDLDYAIRQLAVAFEISRRAFRTKESHKPRRDVGRGEIKRALARLAARAKPSSMLVDRTAGAFKRAGLSPHDAKEAAQAAFGLKPPDTSELEVVLQRMATRLDRLDERFEALSVAGDPGEYAWFRQLVPHAVRSWNGEDDDDWYVPPPRRSLSQADYRRAVDFVITIALRWEQLPAPPLDEGTDHSDSSAETDGEAL